MALWRFGAVSKLAAKAKLTKKSVKPGALATMGFPSMAVPGSGDRGRGTGKGGRGRKASWLESAEVKAAAAKPG